MKSTEIRKKFFDFFVRNHHEQVASSSLIPAQDPTLLFANAGMNQFKDLFLGLEHRAYKRAVTIQKCVRAGGKHNDLDNVGFTKRHLTFFEMMGNFSFGDYFKKQAIGFAWDFITKELHIPTDKLHVSVFKDDQESYDLWHKDIGIPVERIHKLGAADNFWQMGETGPCGPCTELYIDRGEYEGCRLTTCAPGCSCDRFLEFWNLVFMQFERQADGTDVALKAPGVDTGMGLERLCAIMQHKESVYETDLFAGIIASIEDQTGKKYGEVDTLSKAAFNVLADHSRSATMLIADGCAPSNEGRGYVLRKIIRRAALFAHKLTDDTALFPQLSKAVVQDLGDIYPTLRTNQALIEKVLMGEIDKFSLNLVRGKQMLQEYCEKNATDKVIRGDQAFKMYDTFGFPLELIQLIAQEHGFTVDMAAFEKEMEKQRTQSRTKAENEIMLTLDSSLQTEFTGYTTLETESKIIALVYNNEPVNQVSAGQTCWVIAEKSPFFIVGGGQVPDKGWLTIANRTVPLEAVQFIGKAIGAQIQAPVELSLGMVVVSKVNRELRVNAMKNHTATHMLQAALIQLFGNHIKQSGSLVHPDYLRFDFTYHENLSAHDIKRVEDLVNEKIREDIELDVRYGTMKDAVSRGALAFFGDKYNPEKVRIVDIPNFSVELCGGTHVPRTGAIGTFKITDSVSLSAGMRRIFAVTGPKAVGLFQDVFNDVKTMSQEFSVKPEAVVASVLKQKEELRQSTLHIKQLKKQLMQANIPLWEAKIERIALPKPARNFHGSHTGGVSVRSIEALDRTLDRSESVTEGSVEEIRFLYLSLEKYSPEELKDSAMALLQRNPGFYFLASKNDDKFVFLAMADKKTIDALSGHVGTGLANGSGSKNSRQSSVSSRDMRQCATFLKDSLGLRCGGSDTMLQGNTDAAPQGLEEKVRAWLIRQG